MSTYQGTRAASDERGSPFEELSGGYYRNGDRSWVPNDPRYRDEKLIGRNPGSPGPGSRKPKVPPAPPRLGCAQVAALTELAGADLTAPEVADRMGREHRSVHAVINSLEVRGLIASRGQRRRKGTAVTVWGATTTGRNVLAAHQRGAKS